MITDSPFNIPLQMDHLQCFNQKVQPWKLGTHIVANVFIDLFK